MSYRLIDIEVTHPLPGIALGEDEQGVALVLRHRGRPIDFLMTPHPPGTALTPAAVGDWIGEQACGSVVEAFLREALVREPPSRRPPTVTIAVCTKDRPAYLARCLASVRAHTAEAAVDVLVVDNAPSDAGTREAVAASPGVRYVVEPRPGLDFARNRAVRAATGELIAFLDDDVVVDRCWFAGLMEAYRENPDAAAFTGLVLPYELRTEAQVLFELEGGFRRGFSKARFHGPSLPGNPLYPCGAGMFGAGANMAFRRDVLLELGGFDEALDTGAPLPGGGDLDAFYRVVRAGYPLVYEPCYLAYHQHRETTAQLRRQYESWGRGFMAFVEKTYRADPPHRRKLRKLVAWWLRYQAQRYAKSVLGRHPLPPGMVAAEIRGGLKGLCGEYTRSVRRTEHIRRHSGVAQTVAPDALTLTR